MTEQHLKGFFCLVALIVVGGFLCRENRLLAQELPPPEEGDSQEEPSQSPSETESVDPDEFLTDPDLPFTGTFEEAYEKKEEEEGELFGDQPAEEEPTEEPPEEEISGTHLIKFEFASRVQFIEPEAYSPHLEIQYSTTFETPFFLTKKRETTQTKARIEIQNWGSLAHNEFFDCRLDIATAEAGVEITSRLRKSAEVGSREEENLEEGSEAAALKISFSEEMLEDWFSFCTDVSGATLNTQGEPEKYNMQILGMIEPSLSGLLLEEFDPEGESRVDLDVPRTTVDDIEMGNSVLLSGEGSITISPLE